MLIVLPPSESKSAAARRGKPVDLGTLSFPELTPLRDKVLAATIATSKRPDALRRLLVGDSLADEVEQNTRLRDLAARPALEVYNGVLYDALDAATLSAAAKRRATTRLIVVSGLWGALRPTDRIPPYRLNVCAQLVGLGNLEPVWREVLPGVLAQAAGSKGLIVDCRSSSYVAMGMPEGLAHRTVSIRVVRDAEGKRSVVSHMAKHTRGEVARHLLETGADPRQPEGLVAALGDRWPVELTPPPRANRPWTADVIVFG